SRQHVGVLHDPRYGAQATHLLLSQHTGRCNHGFQTALEAIGDTEGDGWRFGLSQGLITNAKNTEEKKRSRIPINAFLNLIFPVTAEAETFHRTLLALSTAMPLVLSYAHPPLGQIFRYSITFIPHHHPLPSRLRILLCPTICELAVRDITVVLNRSLCGSGREWASGAESRKYKESTSVPAAKVRLVLASFLGKHKSNPLSRPRELQLHRLSSIRHLHLRSIGGICNSDDTLAWPRIYNARLLQYARDPDLHHRIGLVLVPSPQALMAWIAVKFLACTDEDLPILEFVSLYRLTRNSKSCAYNYWAVSISSMEYVFGRVEQGSVG
ncbi:hypothetical protein BUE80_DR008599, partial [Diplocarpon rosae]